MIPQRDHSPSCFPTTQWTQVIEVIQRSDPPTAMAALNEFCERYRPAVYQFFRRKGRGHEVAEDYTQEFFTSRVLKQWDRRTGFLYTAERGEQRRFRSFLAHVLWRFLQTEWTRERSSRTGGSTPHLSLADIPPSEEPAADDDFKSFGSEFDRAFALEILQRAARRSKHSKYLLAHFFEELSQSEAARELGYSENSFKQAYHRFRERLARDLWEEVAQLAGPDENEIRAEIRYLMSLFGNSPRA